jgi:hypothetical protein
MKIHGYCEKCRRIRRVTVRSWLGTGPPVGVCGGCSTPERLSPAEPQSPVR